MTSSMPSGDGTVTSSPPDTELDTEAAPETGLEPGTAADAAGQTDSSAAADVSPGPDVEAGPESAVPSGESADSDAQAGQPEDESRTPDRTDALTEIDGPASENEEMRRGTDDLRSSEEKTTQAREIAKELREKTLPGNGNG